jgi:hypothetical protein
MKTRRMILIGFLTVGGLALFGASLLVAPPPAGAATPVPSPTATAMMAIPTSMYSTTAPISNTFDPGFWDFDTYQKVQSAAWSWYDVANRYHIINLMAIFAITSVVIGLIAKLILNHIKAK